MGQALLSQARVKQHLVHYVHRIQCFDHAPVSLKRLLPPSNTSCVYLLTYKNS